MVRIMVLGAAADAVAQRMPGRRGRRCPTRKKDGGEAAGPEFGLGGQCRSPENWELRMSWSEEVRTRLKRFWSMGIEEPAEGGDDKGRSSNSGRGRGTTFGGGRKRGRVG